MKLYEVSDPEFKPYGKILERYNTEELRKAMSQIPMPDTGTNYEATISSLETCRIRKELEIRGFGGMPIEIGMCWGYNTKLNCLEYHRDSEINIGDQDFVLLLAKMEEIENGKLDTKKVKAFRVPAGIPVEIYGTSLHYVPCHLKTGAGFRVAVVLPKGTNLEVPVIEHPAGEEKWMTAKNKWLLAHPESTEAAGGVYVGLTGSNIDIAREEWE